MVFKKSLVQGDKIMRDMVKTEEIKKKIKELYEKYMEESGSDPDSNCIGDMLQKVSNKLNLHCNLFKEYSEEYNKKIKISKEINEIKKRKENKGVKINKIKSVYGENCKDIKWTKKFKAGYILQEEGISYESPEKLIYLIVGYNLNGDYIGNAKSTRDLCIGAGIAPKKANPEHKVCSIGYCESEKKYFGWSHRAICGFKIGDTVKKGDCTNSSGYTEEHLKNHPEDDKSLPVGFEAKNLDDCKKMAIAFAESVS